MAPEQAPASPSPAASLAALIWSFRVTQALHVAATLGLADLLADGPRSVAALAAATGAHAPTLRRLLRALTTVALLTEDEQGCFATTPLGDHLRADHPRSLRALATLTGDPFIWAAWGDLCRSILTGAPAFARVYGEPDFDYLAKRPALAATFHATMTGFSRSTLPDLLTAYDFAGHARIVDVGGGQGALLRGILERYPRAAGVLFDLPFVVAEARELRGTAVAGRCELVGGDMFRAVPAGGDAYLLKLIVHDWDDDAALRVLRHCRAGIVARGRLLVLEAVVAPSNAPDPAKWADLNMLVMRGGRERTADEFRALYTAAGFRLARIIPAGAVSVIEGIPV